MPIDSPGSPAPKVDLRREAEQKAESILKTLGYYERERKRFLPPLTNILLAFADHVRGEEIERLRQGLWDVYRILGFDTDGQETPHALAHPDIVDLLVRSAEEFRRDYDEAISERGEREKRLREALRKYGKHAAACYEPTVFYGTPGGSSYTSGKVKECVCGLARALAEGGDD